MQFEKVFINPGLFIVSYVLFLQVSSLHLLADIAPLPHFLFNLVASKLKFYSGSIGHYLKEINRRVFSNWYGFELDATVVIVQAIIRVLYLVSPRRY